MKRIALFVGLLCTLAAPANAQSWSPQCADHWNINAIQQSLQNRIRIGAQNGSLNRNEVARLQAQFDRINDLERQLRRGGLNSGERNRLDNELDNLSANIYRESHDGDFLGARPWGWIHTPSHRPRGWDDRRWNSTRWDDRRWEGNRYNIDERESNLDKRISDGRRDGSLTGEESRHLRNQEEKVEREEDKRRADGRLSSHDREVLDKRMDNLSKHIHKERHDKDRHD